jgi:hypothetical protein
MSDLDPLRNYVYGTVGGPLQLANSRYHNRFRLLNRDRKRLSISQGLRQCKQ